MPESVLTMKIRGTGTSGPDFEFLKNTVKTDKLQEINRKWVNHIYDLISASYVLYLMCYRNILPIFTGLKKIFKPRISPQLNA